jgi:hypothetical protein
MVDGSLTFGSLDGKLFSEKLVFSEKLAHRWMEACAPLDKNHPLSTIRPPPFTNSTSARPEQRARHTTKR